MQRPARTLILAFSIECRGDRFRIRVQFQHRVQPRPVSINLLNTLQVMLNQAHGHDFSPLHISLPFHDRSLTNINNSFANGN
jgi:hypothetical protein